MKARERVFWLKMNSGVKWLFHVRMNQSAVPPHHISDVAVIK